MTFAPFARSHINLYTKGRIYEEDAKRQERTAEEVLRRLAERPGVILADEVGMGKTFVALAVATSILLDRFGRGGPIVVMVPPTLIEKWPADWKVFQGRCLEGNARLPLRAEPADSGIAFLKLLEKKKEERPHLIFLKHGALHRSLTDGFVKLAVIRRAFKGRSSLGRQRKAFAKFAGPLLQMETNYEHHAPGLLGRLLEKPSEKWLPILHRAHPSFVEKHPEPPVPARLQTALERIDSSLLHRLIGTLRQLPLKKGKNIAERLKETRRALAGAMSEVWNQALKDADFVSPLLILDEAHHLKNPAVRLASLFIHEEAAEDSEAIKNDGALADKFERMLFLTATPFQLGHYELINVLERFEGIRWTGNRAPGLKRSAFKSEIAELAVSLNDAYLSALRLDSGWGKLREDMLVSEESQRLDVDTWWDRVKQSPKDDLTRQVVEQVEATRSAMRHAETLLRPWVLRKTKSDHLPEHPDVPRRCILPGAAIQDNGDKERGLEVQGDVLLPFLLAGRARKIFAASTRGRALFAEGLASSFEAYLETRAGKGKMDEDAAEEVMHTIPEELNWYLRQLDRVLPRDDAAARSAHPKVRATAERVVKLWGKGEKVLVFCHYRATGKALQQHISTLLQADIVRRGKKQLPGVDVVNELKRIGERFFDNRSPLYGQVTEALQEVVSPFVALTPEERERIVEIVRRFLRTPSFLVRYLDLTQLDRAEAYVEAIHRQDAGGLSLSSRIENFCRFLADRSEDRPGYLDAVYKLRKGNQMGWDVTQDFDAGENIEDARRTLLLPNVRLANGATSQETRRRLLLAFNTPLFPEILIASSVLAEGVDLHLNCRHVIHHDLCWNPSTLEQRTGRVDRLGSHAEHVRKSIIVYLPYVAATQDEKMYRVVRDRERWFQIVLGAKYAMDETDESATDRRAARVPLPHAIQKELALNLQAEGRYSD
ncbi:MAG: C-terminal helicase domain-containing protein [Gemmataceae bacterium]